MELSFFNKLSAHFLPNKLADSIGPIFISSTKLLVSSENKRAFNTIELFLTFARAAIGVKQSPLICLIRLRSVFKEIVVFLQLCYNYSNFNTL